MITTLPPQFKRMQGGAEALWVSSFVAPLETYVLSKIIMLHPHHSVIMQPLCSRRIECHNPNMGMPQYQRINAMKCVLDNQSVCLAKTPAIAS